MLADPQSKATVLPKNSRRTTKNQTRGEIRVKTHAFATRHMT